MAAAHTRPYKIGSDDDDVKEKPKFAQRASAKKVPFVLSKPEDPVLQVPATINQYLRDYQRDGIQFLYDHYVTNEGAILGDDMGLGKTIQVIGFMSAVLKKTGTDVDLLKQRPMFIRKMSDATFDEEEEKQKRPFLIIGPASVLYNWVDELDVWGYFSVGKFHQSHKKETLALLEKGRLDVVVTTFETCRDHVEELNAFKWSAVIADEVHKIKGLNAEITGALKKLRCKRRFGLTGTLLQNNLTEVWCILDWIVPKRLGTLANFVEKIAKPIELGQKHDATKRELAEGRKAMEELAAVKNQFMIRRLKTHIADQLPKKEEMVVYCKLTELQVSVYKALLNQADMKLILNQHNLCDCGRKKNRGKCCYKTNKEGQKVAGLTFMYMHLLLKVANHVGLLLPEKTRSDNQRKYATAVCKEALIGHSEFVQQAKEASFRTLSDPKHCGKMKVLQGLLKVFRKQGSKVLLFSYSVQLLDILEHHVMCSGYEYRRLDGRTSNVKRMQIVREFNKDANIFLFLASTKAGGIGLNLTGANVVVIYDPNWNPTHDLQAQDRAYRLGQGRDVRIYHLISSGTIEENIYLRQVYKQQLDNVAVSEVNAKRYFHGIQGDKKNKGELFGIENMFKLRTGDSCLTSDIISRNENVEGLVAGVEMTKYIKQKPASDQSDGRAMDGQVSRKMQHTKKTENDDQFGLHHVYNTLMIESDEEIDIDEFLSEEESFDTKLEKIQKKSEGMISKPMSHTKDKSCQGDLYNMKQKKLQSGYIEGSDEGSSPKPSTSNIRTIRKRFCVNSSSEDEKEVESGKAQNYSGRGRKRTAKGTGEVKYKGAKVNFTAIKVKGPSLDWCSSDEEDHGKGTKGKDPAKKVKFDDKVGTGVMVDIGQTLESVSDVLMQCGVVHTHQNSKLIGASKAEDHMSRMALKDVYELHHMTQAPAMECDPYSDSTELESEPEEDHDVESVSNTARRTSRKKPGPSSDPSINFQNDKPVSLNHQGQKILVGQTPKAICQKHLNKLLAKTKHRSLTELAELLVQCSDDDLEMILQKFYGKLHPDVVPLLNNSKCQN